MSRRSPTEGRRRTAWRVARQIVVLAVAVVGSGFLLSRVFDDLDLASIGTQLGSLSDAEWLSLGAGWVVMLAVQGQLTAALLPALPVRRGVLAFLGPTAVASLVPGPSDLPVKHRMFTSWGVDGGEATIAVSASGVFSIGSKLLLPVIAALGLVLTGAPIDGALVTVVQIALLVGAAVAAFVYVVSSPLRLGWVTAKLEPAVSWGRRLLGRDGEIALAGAVLGARAETVEVLRRRWGTATWATVLTAGVQCALLVMSLRFAGVPPEAVGWSGIFVAFALVQGLTALPVVPGSVGVTEVAYVAMLSAAAGSGLANEIAAGVLINRLLVWLALIPAGGVALVIWRRSVAERGPAPSGDHPTDDGRPGAER